MKHPLYHTSLVIFLLVMAAFSPQIVSAQVRTEGVPVSFSRALAPVARQFTIDPPDLRVIHYEDSVDPVPYRFSVNLAAHFDYERHGKHETLRDGMHLWRLSVAVPGALATSLYFSRFNLPEGSRLFVYNPSRTRLLGAYTGANNNRMQSFATELLYGDHFIVEYNAPRDAPDPVIVLSEIAYAYRGITDYTEPSDGFGGSGKCQVNVACSEGDPWGNLKRSVVRIQIKRATGNVWCSGVIVNNVRNDGTPYILTADHCGRYSTPTDLSQWLFYFNYQGNACADPLTEPALKSMTGAELIAHGGLGGNAGSDFYLVKLNEAIPDSYQPYFSGWSRIDTPPSDSGVGIHHPQGDIKKISTYRNPLIQTVWTGGSKLAHWQVNWSETENGHGTTEGGSSGSPIFDSQGLLVGTLTGGDSSCDSADLNLPDYYGMFSYSWDKNGTDSNEVLKVWLDPDNTNIMTLNGWSVGIDAPPPAGTLSVSPNPFFDLLTIGGLNPSDRSGSVELVDISGKRVMETGLTPGISQVTLRTGNLKQGVYILRVRTSGQTTAQKVVKLN
jgi:hypothetical protein